MAKEKLASIHYDSAPRPQRSCFVHPNIDTMCAKNTKSFKFLHFSKIKRYNKQGKIWRVNAKLDIDKNLHLKISFSYPNSHFLTHRLPQLWIFSDWFKSKKINILPCLYFLEKNLAHIFKNSLSQISKCNLFLFINLKKNMQSSLHTTNIFCYWHMETRYTQLLLLLLYNTQL